MTPEDDRDGTVQYVFYLISSHKSYLITVECIAQFNKSKYNNYN